MPAFLFGTLLKSGLVLAKMDDSILGSPMWTSILIGITGGAVPAAVLFSVLSSGAAGLMQQPFVLAARARGLSEWGIRRHLTPNLLVIVRPLLGRCSLMLISGIMFSEVVFDVAGFGRLFLEATFAADYRLLQTWTLVVAALVFLLSTHQEKSL